MRQKSRGRASTNKAPRSSQAFASSTGTSVSPACTKTLRSRSKPLLVREFQVYPQTPPTTRMSAALETKMSILAN